MANTYIKRDLSVSETIYKYTWSAWVKRSNVSAHNTIFKSRADGNNWVQCFFESETLYLQSYKNGGYHYNFRTNRRFRDTNAWYHIFLNVDSSQSTASDRVKIYVNGELETSFSTSTNNLSNGDSLMFNLSDSGTGHTIGSWNTSNYLDGVLSHVHYSSGYSYAPTVFGSTDSTTGEWKINTSPSFTLGGNGYTVLKDGNTITDQSSNSNDFTLGGGTLTKTEDNPSNVFATLNPLDNYYANATFSNGNTKITTGTSREASVTATIPMFKGKYYWEAKTLSSSAPFLGIQPIPSFGNTASPAPLQLNGYGLLSTGKVETTNGSGGSIVLATYATYTAGDIIGIAVDLDSAQNKIYFYKNGTLLGASGVNITSVGSTSQGMYLAAFGVIAGQDTIEVNFGNGYFGTTAVSSAGTNASGNGIFEYDVPANFTALSTKGLNL